MFHYKLAQGKNKKIHIYILARRFWVLRANKAMNKPLQLLYIYSYIFGVFYFRVPAFSLTIYTISLFMISYMYLIIKISINVHHFSNLSRPNRPFF